MIRVFVYGSLKRGFRHHDVMEAEKATFLGAARTAPGFRLIRYGEYPALTHGGSGFVTGELYEVTEGALAALDEFEDCPDLYQREEIALEDGAVVFSYVVSQARAARFPAIGDGIWRERR